MRKLFILIAMALTFIQFNAVTHGAESAQPVAGMLLWSQDGHNLGRVYAVDPNGAVKVIVEGKLVTVPAASLQTNDGSVTTSLKKSEIYQLK
jgi:hypothetical protein